MLRFPASKIILLITALLVSAQFAADLNGPLWEQDEAAYAGFSHHMLETGDWVVPEYAFSEPHRKPPLHFWMIATSFLVFGANEIAVRLPSILSFLGAVGILAWLGSILYGRRQALLASHILLTAFFFSNFAKISLTDSVLLLCQCAAVLSLALYIRSGRTVWLLLLSFATAMGLLAKGPPILILLGGPILFSLFQRESRKRLFHPFFILAMVVAFLPLLFWGWLAWNQTDGDLIRWMVDWYILRRAGGTVFGQTAPPGFYLLFFLIAFLPWSPALFGLIRRHAKELTRIRSFLSGLSANHPFELGWALSGWIFYEILPSKLPSYIMGAAPLFAIVMAGYILSIKEQSLPLYYRLAAPAGALLNVLLWVIVPPLIHEKRSASLEMARTIDRAASTKQRIYISESFRLPGVAFYSEQPVKTIASMTELIERSQCSDCILVLDDHSYLLLRVQQGMQGDRHEVYLWDRGKTVPYFIVRPNASP